MAVKLSPITHALQLKRLHLKGQKILGWNAVILQMFPHHVQKRRFATTAHTRYNLDDIRVTKGDQLLEISISGNHPVVHRSPQSASFSHSMTRTCGFCKFFSHSDKSLQNYIRAIISRAQPKQRQGAEQWYGANRSRVR